MEADLLEHAEPQLGPLLQKPGGLGLRGIAGGESQGQLDAQAGHAATVVLRRVGPVGEQGLLGDDEVGGARGSGGGQGGGRGTDGPRGG